MIGTHLGPYEIREEIGQGGMAIVYRAYQASMERDVALKVVSKALVQEETAISRFQREARLVARLEHPHILPIYDFDGRSDPPYLVMRYLDGGTLEALLRQGPLPFDRLRPLMSQICSALDYAHRQGIVHRDIKPSNILLDQEGNAFVADFGVARMVSEPEARRITHAGAILGTFDYMAPEQFMDSNVDQQADLYALGVILYQMLTGEMPYQATNLMSLLAQRMRQPVPRVTARCPELSPLLDEVAARAMADEPQQRYPSAAALFQALVVALSKTSPAGPSLDLPPSEPGGAAVLHNIPASGITSLVLEETGSAGESGAPEQVGASAQNRMVTVIVVSVARRLAQVAEVLGAETAQRALSALRQAAPGLVDSYGGQVVSDWENHLVALWGSRFSRENDAECAIRAALHLQEAVRQQGFSLGLTLDFPDVDIGIHSGLALLTDTQAGISVSGETPSLANRLMQAAQGQILISQTVYRGVRGLFLLEPVEMPYQGRKDQVALVAYRVLGLQPQPERLYTRGLEGVETPLVGREAEMKALQNALRIVVEERETQMVTVMGAAGLGKSRLLYEFYRWLEESGMDYRRLRGRATPEMVHQPYALLRDLFSLLFDIRDNDLPPAVRYKLEAGVVAPPGQPRFSPDPETAHLLGYLAGYDLGESPYLQGWEADAQRLAGRAQAAFFAWVRRLCQAHPVLVALEDLHYADPASLDLLNALVHQGRDLPLLVIGLARPEFYGHRPDWGSGQVYHTRLELHPLDKWDSRSLLRAILKKVTAPPKALMDLLVERAEGNPYYLEELVRMLIDERVILRQEPETWQVEVGRLDENAVPSTLVGLIQSNLDGLYPPERLILQRAAVIGRVFYDGALMALDAADIKHPEAQEELLAQLAASGQIQRREFSAFSGCAEYIFSSGMLHDVLLSTLTAEQRQVYHSATADWLEAASGQRVEEWSSVIGGHYAAAGEDRLAAAWYIRSGKNAFQQDASQEALQLYRRALELLPAGAQESDDLLQRWQASLGLYDALKRRNQFEACLVEGEKLLALAQALQDPSHQAEATLRIGHVHQSLGHFEQALERYQETMHLAKKVGDLANHALAQALQVFCWVQMGNLEKAGVASAEVLEAVKDLQDQETRVRVYHNTAMYFSATGDYARAVQLTRQHVDINRQLGNRYGEAMGLANEGYYEVMMGLYDLAQPALERSISLLGKLGDQQALAYNQLNLGLCHLLRGTIHPSEPDVAQMAQAETWFQLAQDNLDGLQDAFGLAASQMYFGLAYEARLDLTAAAGCYAAAARRYEKIGAQAVAQDAQAGLARCALGQTHLAGLEEAALQEALAAAELVWEALLVQGGEGMEFPALAYLTCCQVFAAAGQAERAQAAQQAGREWLRLRAARISEPSWRESFLQDVPAHRRLGQAC